LKKKEEQGGFMIRIILMLFTIMLLAGCAAKYDAVLPTPEKFDNFMEGTVQVKSVGDPIIKQDDLLLYPGFVNEKEVVLPEKAFMSFSPLPAGSKCKVKYKYEDGLFFCEPMPDVVIINKSALIQWPVCLIFDSTGKLIGIANCNYPGTQVKIDEYQGINFQKTTVYAPGSMRKEILYNGKSKDTIKITYREYMNDMARPAFYQDLNYDLIESKIIGFKGTQIEIIDATNSDIKYKVIKKNLF
jgi:hypothetical protein